MSFNDKISLNEFREAYKKVKKGKQKLSDKKFIKFETNDLNSLGKFYNPIYREYNLEKLIDDFSNNNYKIQEYVCVVLRKNNGKFRTLLVPKARDRIIFTIILRRLKKKILPKINEYNVFGSGGRNDFENIGDIIKEIYKTSLKYKYILKIDIKSFFPSIDKKILLKNIKDEFGDGFLYNILESSFNNRIIFKFDKNISIKEKEGVRQMATGGIPQGCAYSPLLANFYALDLDRLIINNNLISFRYLDDMIIFSNSEDEAKNILIKLKEEAGKLNLKIHDLSAVKNKKTYIQKSKQTFEYLGIEINKDGSFSIPIEKIKDEVKFIKSMLVNQETIKKFSAKRVHNILVDHINGWKLYYKNNFETAYENFNLIKEVYNQQLLSHYKNHPSFTRYLSKSNISINQKSLYL